MGKSWRLEDALGSPRRVPRTCHTSRCLAVSHGRSRSLACSPAGHTFPQFRGTWGDRTSKLVMRVRFPSSALLIPRLVSRTFRWFSRYYYDARLGRRARCVPDRLASVPVFLVLVLLASANSLPMPAAIFWSRSPLVAAWSPPSRTHELAANGHWPQSPRRKPSTPGQE